MNQCPDFVSALMLRYSFGLEKEASAIEAAIDDTIKDGFRTGDIAGANEKVSTTEELAAQS